jgi:hypothetical protein
MAMDMESGQGACAVTSSERSGRSGLMSKVQVLPDGSAVVAWQGGTASDQDIFARWIKPDGTFATGDIRVNNFTDNHQVGPALAALPSGEVVVTWSSFEQDGSLMGVFGRVIAPTGTFASDEFQINQTSPYNQRNPAVAGLKSGGFVSAWVSEQKRFERSVDISARLFRADGTAVTGELLVNATTNICANPSLLALPGGGFLAAWSERDLGVSNNSWDVFARRFNANGFAEGQPFKVNSHFGGSHFGPQLALAGDYILAAWTSIGQDGSREGVYGRFMDVDGRLVGDEFRVNTTTASQQMHPTVASNGSNGFLVAWTSFIGGPTSFDLFAQQYRPAQSKPSPPIVSAVGSSSLSVTWPDAGNSVANYEVYFADRLEPYVVEKNYWSINSLAPGTTYSVRIAIRYGDGDRSLMSDPATGITWGSDDNFDGLPDDWQRLHWGDDPKKWPSPNADTDGDGATNLQEFLAGTNPTDPSSVLKLSFVNTSQGRFIQWNTQPGYVYQLQVKEDLASEWKDLGSPRFAAGSSDSALVSQSTDSNYYRIKRLR